MASSRRRTKTPKKSTKSPKAKTPKTKKTSAKRGKRAPKTHARKKKKSAKKTAAKKVSPKRKTSAAKKTAPKKKAAKKKAPKKKAAKKKSAKKKTTRRKKGQRIAGTLGGKRPLFKGGGVKPKRQGRKIEHKSAAMWANPPERPAVQEAPATAIDRDVLIAAVNQAIRRWSNKLRKYAMRADYHANRDGTIDWEIAVRGFRDPEECRADLEETFRDVFVDDYTRRLFLRVVLMIEALEDVEFDEGDIGTAAGQMRWYETHKIYEKDMIRVTMTREAGEGAGVWLGAIDIIEHIQNQGLYRVVAILVRLHYSPLGLFPIY